MRKQTLSLAIIKANTAKTKRSVLGALKMAKQDSSWSVPSHVENAIYDYAETLR